MLAMRQLWSDPKFLAAIRKGQANPLPLHSIASATPASPANQPQVGDLHSITISPTKIFAGEHQQFTAMGLDYGGESQIETEVVEWSSSDPSRLSFDGNKKGLAYAHRQPETGPVTAERGPVTVTATEPNSQKFGTTTVTILPARVSEMSESDRAAQEAEANKPKKYDGHDKAHRLGIKDAEAGHSARPELMRKFFAGHYDILAFVTAYKVGYEKGSYARLEAKVGPLQAKGKTHPGAWAASAYESGFSDGRSGKATRRGKYEKSPENLGFEEGVLLRAYDLGFRDSQAAVPQDKLTAHQVGVADGTSDDPIHRKDIAEAGKPDLLASYERGFIAGRAASDRTWEDAGVAVDATTAANPPDTSTPGAVKFDGALTGIGFVAAAISVLEAGGSMARAGVGTTIGVWILPIIAFRAGTVIGEELERKEAARTDFTTKLIAGTTLDALQKMVALVKSKGGTAVATLNDEGQELVKQLYDAWKLKMSEVIRKELDDSPSQAKFQALHSAWVKKMSKGFADIYNNPRLRQ